MSRDQDDILFDKLEKANNDLFEQVKQKLDHSLQEREGQRIIEHVASMRPCCPERIRVAGKDPRYAEFARLLEAMGPTVVWATDSGEPCRAGRH